MFSSKKESDQATRDEEYAVSLGLRYPLDASQLPRLMNLRIEKAGACECDRCGDLLDNLHTKTKMLEHAHSAESPGVSFWSQTRKDGLPSHFETELDKKLRLSPDQLTRHDEFIDSLVEVEHNWQRSQRVACTSDDSDDFWLRHYGQMKHNISTQPKEDGESLEELRNGVLGITSRTNLP